MPTFYGESRDLTEKEIAKRASNRSDAVRIAIPSLTVTAVFVFLALLLAGTIAGIILQFLSYISTAVFVVCGIVYILNDL